MTMVVMKIGIRGGVIWERFQLDIIDVNDRDDVVRKHDIGVSSKLQYLMVGKAAEANRFQKFLLMPMCFY